MNDTGDVYSPELKVKRLLDQMAYYLLLGHTDGIETDYKRVMHAQREIPVSSCPSYVESMLYASGSNPEPLSIEEEAHFRTVVEQLDERAEKYVVRKPERKKRIESRYHKRERLGIRGIEWCRVDTTGGFEFDGKKYRIDPSETQYQPIRTEFGELYDMDRILVAENPPEKFYDMNYDEVMVNQQ